LPERLGDWKNTHRRFSRWAKTGVWEGIFQHLAADADNEYAMFDSINAKGLSSASTKAWILCSTRRGCDRSPDHPLFWGAPALACVSVPCRTHNLLLRSTLFTSDSHTGAGA
jgi:hypothetical protein